MGFTLSYKTLFEVKILHHYFLDQPGQLFDNISKDADLLKVLNGYDVRNFLTITPTASCAKILSKYRLIFRATSYGLIVGTRVVLKKAKLLPAILFDKDVSFTFKVGFNDVNFLNYTALPLQKATDSLYYFQNASSEKGKKFPYLSQFASKFITGTAYSSGDILADKTDDPGQIFIAKNVNSKNPATASTTDWIKDTLVTKTNKPLQYATQNDLMKVFSDSIRFNTNKDGLSPTVEVKNRTGTIMKTKVEIIPEDDNTVVLVDIHLLPEGLYSISIKDTTKAYSEVFSFYRLEHRNDANALIEIAINSDMEDYKIMASDDTLQSPVYEIRFKNRSTLWKYIGKKFAANTTSGPHPLTKNGVVPVTVKDSANVDCADMPNAGIRMIQVDHPEDNNKHYNVISEIFIH